MQMQQDPLAQLKDIDLPPEVGLWPPAWPWWLMLIFILSLVALAILFYMRNRWRKRAVSYLHDLASDDQQQEIIAINRLLKQIYVNRYKEGHALSGIKWLASLDRKTQKPLFLPELEDFAHAPDSGQPVDINLLRTRAEQWIRRAQ